MKQQKKKPKKKKKRQEPKFIFCIRCNREFKPGEGDTEAFICYNCFY